MNFAKQALFGESKPHSSVTEWVELLTAPHIADEAYDGIPELVDSINIQTAGPTEASRAIRKKLKHGSSHQQYRSLVILKALVDNCGHKFQTTFADGQLTDAIKHLVADPGTNAKVKKKTLAVLASWHAEYKGDPAMAVVAGLYPRYRTTDKRKSADPASLGVLGVDVERDRRRAEKEDAKSNAKMEKEASKEKERARREAEQSRIEVERNKSKIRPRRAPFDFEREKPAVLTAIANASQAANNLVNAITLVNPAVDSIETNVRVQECLEKAKLLRKPIVRYIQLVENEELIGTLIDTNERIIGAMETYDQLKLAGPEAVADQLASTHITPESEVTKLQERQRAAVERAKRGSESNERAVSGRGKQPRVMSDSDEEARGNVHPDLQDLSFGVMGSSERGNLPPPMRPDGTDGASNARGFQSRGSLSDFSDYESSSDEGRPTAASSSSHPRGTQGGRTYVHVSDDPDDEPRRRGPPAAPVEEEDPFADPFEAGGVFNQPPAIRNYA